MHKTVAAHTPEARSDSGAAVRLVRWLVVALALSGCDDVPEVVTFEPITDPRELFASVTLEHRAINLSTAAPYDTFRLVPVPRNALGEPIAGLPAPTFESSDTTRVQVMPDGLLQARRATAIDWPVQVVAKIVAENNIAHVDTALVHVTANPNPPRIQSLRISPDPSRTMDVEFPSEGLIYYGMLYLASGMPLQEVLSMMEPRLVPQFLDESGRPVMTGSAYMAVDFRSSNPDALEVRSSGYLNPFRMETVRVTARAVVYGVEVSDSVDVRVVYPTHIGIAITEDEHGNLSLKPKEVTVSPNARVLWINASGSPVDIVFDRPDDVVDDPELCNRMGGDFCGRGDIPAFTGGPEDMLDPSRMLNAMRLRRFPEPGVYTYRSTLTGLTGRLVVKDD